MDFSIKINVRGLEAIPNHDSYFSMTNTFLKVTVLNQMDKIP